MNGNAIKNFGCQGILAKLLATENISVHIGDYSTAFFDVKNRILGLPSWNVDSKEVSDLLIGHEVGHALWTPVDGIENFKKKFSHIPFSILNVVEDVRIERMIKDKYPGLRTTFLRGYTYFIEKDFFKIAGKDLNSLNFVDRLNIKAKLQELIDINFSPKEQIMVDRCNKAETFEEVIQIVSDIYEMVKEKPKKKDKAPALKQEPERKPKKESKEPEDQSSDDEGGDDTDPTQGVDEVTEENPEPKKSESDKPIESETTPDECDDTEEVKSDSAADDAEEDEDEKQSGSTTSSDENDDDKDDEDKEDSEDDLEDGTDGEIHDSDITPSTQDSLDSQLEQMHTKFGSSRPIIPPSKKDCLSTIIPWAKVQESRMIGTNIWDYKEDFLEDEEVKKDWSDFKNSTKSHIQYLVTNFERRKAAYQYSRSNTSDTGDISLNKLHAYKYEDQIFNSITTLADAKDHGMLFFVDYSGSMSNILSNVLNQTLNLVMFCKAVSIPFRVYGFTSTMNEYSCGNEEVDFTTISLKQMKLIELVRSDMKKSDYDIAIRYMRAQAFCNCTSDNSYFSGKLFSQVETLGQTPLLHTIIAAHDIIDDFRKYNKVQKLNTIFITDGASNQLSFGHDRHNAQFHNDSGRWKSTYTLKLHGRNITIRREKNENYNYSILIENLKLTKNCTVIGFYLSDRGKNTKITGINAHRYNRDHGFTDEHRPTWASGEEKFKGAFIKQLKKDKVGFVHGAFNYDCFFIMESANLKINDDEFTSDVDFDDLRKRSNQNKLMKEFEKFNSSKKNSRVFLAKFAEIIA